MHDLDLSFNRVPSSITLAQRSAMHPHSLSLPSLAHPLDSWAEAKPWVTTLHKILAAKDMDARCGRQLPRLFAEAGLQDVRIKRYVHAHTHADAYRDVEKRYAVHHRDSIGAHMPDLIRKLGMGQDVVSKEEIEAAAEGARKNNEDWETGSGFCWFYVVCGRKAME